MPDKTASSFALPPSFTSTFACRCRAQRPQGTEQTARGCGRKVMAKQTHGVILMISVLVLCLPEPFLTLLLRAGTSSTQETRTHLQSLCKAAVSPRSRGVRGCALPAWGQVGTGGPGGLCEPGSAAGTLAPGLGRVQGAGRDPMAPCGAGTRAVVTSPRCSDRLQALPTASCLLPEPEKMGFEGCQQSVGRG